MEDVGKILKVRVLLPMLLWDWRGRVTYKNKTQNIPRGVVEAG